MNHTSLGIHIALSKYPLGSEKSYASKLTELYTRYKNNINDYLGYASNSNQPRIDTYLEHLYKPAIYHMYSHFDVAFISLVENFKFPQRVFEPVYDEAESLKSVSYQILSGSVLETSGCKKPPHEMLQLSRKFLKIIQLKFNNGLIIGNGWFLFEACLPLIEEKLTESGINDYLVIDSYNWSEVTILAFADDPGNIAAAVLNLRGITLGNIKNQQQRDLLEERSLYRQLNTSGIIPDAHIFCESMSYLGVDYENYALMNGETRFNTQVEWQIKPGHLPYFIEAIGDAGPLQFTYESKYDGIKFKNGKTDYFVSEKTPDKLSSNIDIFNKLRSAGTNQIHKHIRKIKTRPLFDLPEGAARVIDEKRKNGFNGPQTAEQLMERFKINRGKEVTGYLRQLNVSRNTRKKVNKIIYNFNLGIQDPVLYIYFIDLHRLIHAFVNDLKEMAEKISEAVTDGKVDEAFFKDHYDTFKTKYIENVIEKYISKIEEALEDRILNNYNYEDFNEFSLDINSSLTSIVTGFDAIIKLFGKCFRDANGNSIIATINNNETVSNIISVNYNIEHITSPPLVFATLIKEILNVEKTRNEHRNEENWQNLADRVDEFMPADYLGGEEIEEYFYDKKFVYFEIDYKKYYLTFFKDLRLYIFWHWAYALQCTHMYSSIGCYDEVNFTRELFRILILVYAVEPAEVQNLACPIPELRTYWDKHFNRTSEFIEKIVRTEEFSTILNSLKGQIYKDVAFETSTTNQQSAINGEGLYEDFYITIRNDCKEAGKTGGTSGIKSFVNDMLYGTMQAGNPLSESGFYRVLSTVSYFNLKYIFEKFRGKVTLLRRDFSNGTPINHFLQCEHVWYIDPFGGFFINKPEEREEYMYFNNKMLALLWHAGMILKKEQFNAAV